MLLAFAPLEHALQPRLFDDPLIVEVNQQLRHTPAELLLAWGIQRGTPVLTSSETPARIAEDADVGALPEDVIRAINELETRYRLNSVVDAGEPGFLEVPQGSWGADEMTKADVVLIGAGIMSATLGTLLRLVEPTTTPASRIYCG